MKRFLFRILLFPLVAVLLQSTASGFAAEWRPYPLIKNGAINENKWRIDGSSAVITPAGDNRVRFVHQGPPAEPTWLSINKCPERVKGMKVTVQMGEDITSHMRARIGSNIGAYGADNDYLWSDLNVLKREFDEGGDEFYGVLAGWDLFNGIWQYDLTYVKFFKPIDLVGYVFRLTLQHDEKKIKFSVDGYGSSIYKLPQIIKPPYELIWSIGTVSIDATGGGTVYFSDVEVLIDGECDTTRPKVKSTYPANDQRKVPVNLEKIRVTFNESMNPRVWEWNPPLSGDTEYRYPKTFVVYNQEDTLAYQTWYEVCLEKNACQRLQVYFCLGLNMLSSNFCLLTPDTRHLLSNLRIRSSIFDSNFVEKRIAIRHRLAPLYDGIAPFLDVMAHGIVRKIFNSNKDLRPRLQRITRHKTHTVITIVTHGGAIISI